MALSSELISQFVKATKDTTETKSETTVYGTIVEQDGITYVRLDGSDLLTPISSTADANPGERVTVLIKNHTATVTGNVSSPSARTGTVQELSIKVGNAPTKDDIDAAIDGIEEFHGTTVDITSSGVAVKTGGTFTVESQKFDVDGNGEMSAVNARISGQLFVDGKAVWNKGTLVVSTVAPENPTDGMIWIKPDSSYVPAAGEWSHNALATKPWKNPYNIGLTGSSIGAAPAGAKYIYEVKVPIFHSFSNSNPYDCTVYLGSYSGSTTINMGTQSFSSPGSNTYMATVESTEWLGDSSTIYVHVGFSSGGYMSVDSGSAFSCNLVAKSTGGGTGWTPCQVHMYAG